MMRPWSWLAAGALALAFSGLTSADPVAVASLLKPLDLRGYPSGTTPPPSGAGPSTGACR